MTAEAKHLSAAQLERFLQDTLPGDQQTMFERHLEVCDACRQQLHDSAAERTWWEEACDFLTNDELEIAGDAGHRTREIRTGSSDDEVRLQHDSLPTDIRQVIAWLDPTDDPAMLGRLGGYEIAGVVGAGGMGVVLKGFDRALNRYVAIKILAPHLATSGAARQRFGREAQAAAAVVHNNVIAIHGVDESNGLPYLVMPYLRGISLQRRIDERGRLSVSEILRIGVQTARGLSAAHDQGLVHRDIKPANILLDGTTDRVLLTDFGLARAADDASLTHSGVIAGTPYFMSPEQAEGAAIDHRSDLFSLGSVLYSMCTGRPPFRADTSWGILRKVTDAEPHPVRDLNAEIPEWLCEIIRRLHQKNADDRIPSAHELADLLEQCLAHVQQPTDYELPATVSRSTARGPRREVTRFGLAAAAGLAVLLMSLFAANRGWQNDAARDTNPPFVRAQERVAGTVAGTVAVTADDATAGMEVGAADAEDVAALTADDDFDESLLDWDDGSIRELAAIRSAVDTLDDDTLRIVPGSAEVRRSE